MADFVTATSTHALELADTMRAADRLELEACGLTPLGALTSSMAAASAAHALVEGGRLLAVGEYCLEPGPALAPRVAAGWVLTSHHVDAAPMALHRAAKQWLRAVSCYVDVMWNVVDARYLASLRWLHALGFHGVQVVTVQPSGLPFVLVRKEF